MSIRLRWLASGSFAVSHVESSNACGAPLKGAIGTPEMPFTIRHFSSTGFSDSGEGPTAPHVHVHLIPRRRGDKVELLDGIDWVTDECVIEQKR